MPLNSERFDGSGLPDVRLSAQFAGKARAAPQTRWLGGDGSRLSLRASFLWWTLLSVIGWLVLGLPFVLVWLLR